MALHGLPAVRGHTLLFHLLPESVPPSALLHLADIIQNSSIFFRCVSSPALKQLKTDG